MDDELGTTSIAFRRNGEAEFDLHVKFHIEDDSQETLTRGFVRGWLKSRKINNL